MKSITPKYDSPLWGMESVRTYFERLDIIPVGMDYGIKIVRNGDYYNPLWMAKAIRKDDGQWTMELHPIDPEHPPQPQDHPTSTELTAIGVELRLYKDWPEYVDHLTPTEVKRDAGLPKQRDNWTLFELLSAEGCLLGYHVRILQDSGAKDYCYLTLWKVAGKYEWKFAQPPGKLPLYNLPALREDTFTGVVAVHEGAKSCLGAIAASKDENHPWRRELAGMTHVAFVGGAHNPYRTDWTPLRRIGAVGTRLVYIFADNDYEGQQSIPKIAQQLNTRAVAVMFRNNFPRKFDMGEPMPANMFNEGHYRGPSLRELLEPATYATELRTIDGKKIPMMRDVFAESFAYLSQVGGFVSFDRPARPPMRAEEFNRAYQHLAPRGYDLAKNLTHKSAQMLTWMCYRPDAVEDLGHCTRVQRTVQAPQGGMFNAYEPSIVQPVEGDIELWQQYLRHLFPNDNEYDYLERFLATLIGRPDIKMELALMMTSHTKGVGKSTLYELFLRPLLGEWNCATIDEHALTSRFAAWMPFKRLAFAHEIYLHGRWDAFQSLKTKITETKVTCEMKYLNPMVVDNFCTIIVCSNSPLPLMMESGDRRWIYPELKERKMPKSFATELRNWALNQQGLEKIMYWAQNYGGEYIGRGEHAPEWDAKLDAIEDSRSEASAIAIQCAQQIAELDSPACFSIQELMDYLHDKKILRPNIRSQIVKPAINEVQGVFIPKGRYKLGGLQGRPHQVVVNKKLVAKIGVENGRLLEGGKAVDGTCISVENLLGDDPI